jgi:hypothetical protein
MRQDSLRRSSLAFDDRRAQALMPLDHLIECGFQRAWFERTVDPIGRRNVIRARIPIELLQKPQALLRRRKR